MADTISTKAYELALAPWIGMGVSRRFYASSRANGNYVMTSTATLAGIIRWLDHPSSALCMDIRALARMNR
jgi:hypothetical protein